MSYCMPHGWGGCTFSPELAAAGPYSGILCPHGWEPSACDQCASAPKVLWPPARRDTEKSFPPVETVIVRS